MLNILRGVTWSVVGPRPEQLPLRRRAQRQAAVLRPAPSGAARPDRLGPGWHAGYAGDERDALEKLQYEFFYLEHQNMTFDLRTRLRTFRNDWWKGHGRRATPEHPAQDPERAVAVTGAAGMIGSHLVDRLLISVGP
ncbi:MAG: hypothetical protein R2696_16850 [Microthrixaceae bacterium]